MVLCLAVSAGAAGALLGVSAVVLVPAVAVALGLWDLVSFRSFLRAPGNARVDAKLRRHLGPLLLAIGLGLAGAAAGLALTTRMPFAVLLLLVIADLACLGYAVRSLSGRGRRRHRSASF